MRAKQGAKPLIRAEGMIEFEQFINCSSLILDSSFNLSGWNIFSVKIKEGTL
jgi:hypothetical protein